MPGRRCWQQAFGRLQAGTAYQQRLDELHWYTSRDAYLVTDELGTPARPAWY